MAESGISNRTRFESSAPAILLLHPPLAIPVWVSAADHHLPQAGLEDISAFLARLIGEFRFETNEPARQRTPPYDEVAGPTAISTLPSGKWAIDQTTPTLTEFLAGMLNKIPKGSIVLWRYAPKRPRSSGVMFFSAVLAHAVDAEVSKAFIASEST